MQVIMNDLEKDVRKMMLPNTALALKESKRNTLKDFLNVAGPMGVTHFVILTATEKSGYMKIAKTPRGPTLTLKVAEYSLVRDVQASLPRPRMPENAFKTAPLVVMNNFGKEEHMQLATVIFQNMFPAINVQKTRLSSCQRIVLLSNNKETSRISLRHYSIGVAPSGLRKSLKGLLQHKELPDLSHMQDVADFVMRSGMGSESEGEDAEASCVTLAQDMGHGNVASRQSRVRLYEIGPRMELEVIKVEEGLCDGRVMYHKHIQRSSSEKTVQQQEHEERAHLKAERRRQQEANVRRKRLEVLRKEADKAAAKLRAQGKDPAKEPGGKKAWWEEELEEAERQHLREEDNDEQYFRDEVGREPDVGDMIRSAKSLNNRGNGRGRGRGGGTRRMEREGRTRQALTDEFHQPNLSGLGEQDSRKRRTNNRSMSDSKRQRSE
ncbi:hypothetical protein CEUSTIGMA_g6443.t1 [Chlamydomonas eustigma]|uniref:Brix domain-containing protein n=1 Tax=Chlamydomonas eustigma TaxID=1157962 RepID=A0A250X7E3_9CHLO|nr:hypothetical protein CEUSTIGMA_g6443.t1 [Chlamydomonas eustigma]|eukprot:GAX79003.1 hypothetical protein CEUSTIGMA_g6443.t1 [Chlamydomonas eustigma]